MVPRPVAEDAAALLTHDDDASVGDSASGMLTHSPQNDEQESPTKAVAYKLSGQAPQSQDLHETFLSDITVKRHVSWTHKSRGTLPTHAGKSLLSIIPQVLVTTVDGSLHSVHLDSGFINWSKSFGPILQGTPQDEVINRFSYMYIGLSCSCV